MKKYKNDQETNIPESDQPALSPEARESQMIALATNCAEERMRNGTASAQIIVHYLRLGTTRERLEKEILEKQKDYIVAKTEAMESAKHVEELYTKAIAAFRRYNGYDEIEEDEYSEL